MVASGLHLASLACTRAEAVGFQHLSRAGSGKRLTFVKLAGVDGASLTAIYPFGAVAKPLRKLAILVRDGCDDSGAANGRQQ
jgi:hypothetical protein